ncbi:MAG TPA: hypothetical protein PLG15_01550 [Candidatus Gastranaerophilaceae bacterium]|nr:hypothetical protein [Candidatus Gastranaerophilaceae bacterium]HPT41052.1 hypothetical protein [Candidatus Gastranaerophilaceae bacterium]
MMQVPTVQPQQAYAQQPSYNAVKIDVHNPQVNAPGATPAQVPSYVTAPVYNVPNASVYEVPQQTIYGPQQNFNQPPVAQQPSVPAPVVVTPQPQTPVAPAAAPQQPEVKAPEAAAPQVDLNAFLGKLGGENLDEQANTMEQIAEITQNNPQKASELLDTRIVDALLAIMQKDTSKLQGPTQKQLEIREKMMKNETVTDAEKAEAEAITPMEKAETNKQYAMYTTAMLQNLYISEIQKMNNTVVPMTELPGAAGIVEQVKNNPNPIVRASGVDSLSYIQRPEYKQDLTTIFTIAQKDQDKLVQEAATKALEKINQVAAAPAATPATEAPKAEAPKAEAPKAA